MKRWGEYERELSLKGYRLIVGADEAGRGAIAGPVMVGMVILPDLEASWLREVDDSKLLSPKKREKLFEQLIKECPTSTGLVTSQEIDQWGIVPAIRLAICRALENLSPKPEFLLLDGFPLPGIPIPYKAIIKGDQLCLSIACASILAKVTRDRIMLEQEKFYPGYNFAQNKGYATRGHLASLRRLNPSPIHRFSFTPLKDMVRDKGFRI